MVPQLSRQDPGSRQSAWGRIECYVPSANRYHTAKSEPDSNTDDRGAVEAWSYSVCQLACPCGAPPMTTPSTQNVFPGCIQQNEVLRHAGAHAIFLDLSSHGSSGCWQNDCTNTDKFAALDRGICARACAQAEDCTHWSFGEQDGTTKCFLRKSDAGREQAEGWTTGSKECSPPSLPDAFLAHTASQLLVTCDSGERCMP